MPDGRGNFCCEVPDQLMIGDRPASIYDDSLDTMWNADQLVETRAAMARGEKPAICEPCWKREATGGLSRRLLLNRTWLGRVPVDALARTGAQTGFRLTEPPEWFVLELGNVCNLKCRSCNPLFSTRIAADPVQNAWSFEVRTAATDGAPWFKDVDRCSEMVAASAERGEVYLWLIGGETFLIDSTWKMLDALVERGVAGNVRVGLLTNGQQRSAELERLAPHFKSVRVSLSVDAHGRLYEYLRHPGRWYKLVDTLDWIRQVPHVDVAVIPTFQNTNALDMVTLLRFVDEHELVLDYNVLNWPKRLRPSNLPPNVRRIASDRLRRYLDEECRPANIGIVRSYREALDEESEPFDPELFEEFMTFTNDLDASRGENVKDVLPELVTLTEGAGITWSANRRFPSEQRIAPPLATDDVLRRVNRTVSSDDVIYAPFETNESGSYFTSAAAQLDEIERRLRERGHPGLASSRAVADYASHFGRMTRVMRAALPNAAVYACDIDPAAVRFCADELGALPVVTGWRPDDEPALPAGLDAIVCVSLLTHTTLEHWRRTLRAWKRMLRPGGVAAFTYNAGARAERWLHGGMPEYGVYSEEDREAAARGVRDEGFGFASLAEHYDGEASYGATFATRDVVEREIAAAGLELIAFPDESTAVFGQELALARRPTGDVAAVQHPSSIQRDVSVVAFYDPRGYAPQSRSEGDAARSTWAQLAAAEPPRPLPTELGFGDPRIAEVRDEQAALARAHGIDAFCWLFPWANGGARWDAPFQDLLATGRPGFPFCVMIATEDDATIDVEEARRIVESLAPALADDRYLRVDGRKLVVVRNVDALGDPLVIANAIRGAAAAHGLGEIHLCAMEPPRLENPARFGFDSLVDPPRSPGDALAAPLPAYRTFRTVECRRDDPDPDAAGIYEHALRAAVETTRRQGEPLVFIDAWNDWLRGRYLEPDDRDGRAALTATRRAARGPAGGLALLRRLRDALGPAPVPAAADALDELEAVLGANVRARDRLLATVEAALGRPHAIAHEPLRRLPVATRQLPPSGGHASLDGIFPVVPMLWGRTDPVVLDDIEATFAGWAHPADCTPDLCEVYVALEASEGGDDRIFRATGRTERPDVPSMFPQYGERCGFEAVVDLRDVPPGSYHVAVVQRTPNLTARDATGVIVTRT